MFDEWDEVMIRKGISSEDRIKRMSIVNEAFPDALVENYESLIGMLELPDEKDKHVLAAAIKTNANLIVSNNLKDFPAEYLAGFSISAKNADDFLTDIIDLNHDTSIRAFKDLVLNKKNPPYDKFEVLDIIRRNGLKDTADYLHALL
ncbi:MAG: PIN domain-containing protein [Bacteroidales bacterium]